MFTKEAARRLQRDFIPGGKSVDISTLRFRKTDDHEIYQCCRKVSHDLQSGPIYCGDIAEYFATTTDGYTCLCQRHKPPQHLIDE